MGAWGIKALESDSGLDVKDFLRDFQPDNNTFTLKEVIEAMKTEGFLGNSLDEIDFYYDNSIMALAELYLEFLDSGKIEDEIEEEEEDVSLERIKTFTTDNTSLTLILSQLKDIQNEVPDEDGERETIELWRDSDSWEEWSEHLEWLIKRFEKLISA